MPKGLLAALCATAVLAVPATAAAAPNNNNSPKLREAVSVPEIREHMEALQAIADANGGNRLAGFAGHDASAAYVKRAPRGRRLRGRTTTTSPTTTRARARRPSSASSAARRTRPGSSSRPRRASRRPTTPT